MFSLTQIAGFIQLLVYLEQWQQNATMMARDPRVCHIRRKSKILVSLAKRSQVTGYMRISVENTRESEKLFTWV